MKLSILNEEISDLNRDFLLWCELLGQYLDIRAIDFTIYIVVVELNALI